MVIGQKDARMETLVYYATVAAGFLLIMVFGSKLGEWIDSRIHRRELELTKNEDDQTVVLMFNGALRAQYLNGLAIGAMVILFSYAMFNVSTGIGPLLTVIGIIVLAVHFERSRRKEAEAARKKLKRHIASYYIESSPALRKIIREAASKGVLSPGFEESRQAWEARLHLDR